MKSLAGADHNDLSLTAAVGRIHRDIGNVLLGSGDEKGAREHYRQALAVTEELVRRASTSLYFQRQHADALRVPRAVLLDACPRRPELKTGSPPVASEKPCRLAGLDASQRRDALRRFARGPGCRAHRLDRQTVNGE